MTALTGRDGRKSAIEAIETTVPHELKVVSLMGKKTYAKYIEIFAEWKRLLSSRYKDVQNYDGSYIYLFQENMIALTREYHLIGYANYGEIIKNNPELITRLSAGTQSFLISLITEEIVDIQQAEYLELSKSTAFDPLTKALELFSSGETWKPKGDEARGPLYVSQVYFHLEILTFGKEILDKSIPYHALRQANPEKFPDYTQQFSYYLISQDKIYIPFKTTIEEMILKHLAAIYPDTIHYVKLSKILNKEQKKVSRQLSRSLKKELVEKVDRGIYRFKIVKPNSSTETEGE